MRANEQTDERVAQPVAQSVFLAAFDHSVLMDASAHLSGWVRIEYFSIGKSLGFTGFTCQSVQRQALSLLSALTSLYIERSLNSHYYS